MDTNFREHRLSFIEPNMTFPFYSPVLTEMYRFDQFAFLFDEDSVFPTYSEESADESNPEI